MKQMEPSASDLWQQLELVPNLESDLQDTVLGQEMANAGKNAGIFSMLEKIN